MTEMPTYASLKLTPRSAARLHRWGLEQGIENLYPPEEFHITVCYSKAPIDYKPLGPIPPMKVKPIGFDMFGKDEWAGTLVMLVKCPFAVNRHNLSRFLGASFDYPTYNPHISLAKKSTVDLAKLVVPDTTFFVNLEVADRLKDD